MGMWPLLVLHSSLEEDCFHSSNWHMNVASLFRCHTPANEPIRVSKTCRPRRWCVHIKKEVNHVLCVNHRILNVLSYHKPEVLIFHIKSWPCTWFNDNSTLPLSAVRDDVSVSVVNPERQRRKARTKICCSFKDRQVKYPLQRTHVGLHRSSHHALIQ